MKKNLFACSLLLMLFACNQSKQSSTTGNTNNISIKDKYWKLVELNGVPIANDGKGSPEIFIVFYTADNRAAGNAGCNRFSGKYELGTDGFTLRFGPLIHTEMACAALETEQAMLKVFEMTDNYFASDSALQLNKAKMAPLARFVAVKGKAIN